MIARPDPSRLREVTSSEFLRLVGPLYLEDAAADPTFWLRVDERHLNTMGGAHGGFVATLADVAAARGARLLADDGRAFRTVSLTVDFLAPAPRDEWLCAVTTLDRLGGRTAFAACRITAADQLVARASVVLAAVTAGSG